MASSAAQPPYAHSDEQLPERTGLETVERTRSRPHFILSFPELKLLGLAGTGFFLDALDLFLISNVSLMLNYAYFQGKGLPAVREDLMKAAVSVGAVIGQIGFGYCSDWLGRKAVYGKEICIIIITTVLCIAVPTSFSPVNIVTWISVFRLLLGIGIGGDYPMSASIVSDRCADASRRGVLLSYVFSMQGWGNLIASIATIIVVAAYKNPLVRGETHALNGAWRILFGITLVPAFAVVYQRLTLPESQRFKDSRKVRADMEFEEGEIKKPAGSRQADAATGEKALETEEEIKMGGRENSSEGPSAAASLERLPTGVEAVVVPKPAEESADDAKPDQFKEFCIYFSEWRHAKLLIATALPWFLIDITLYGINLNTSVILTIMGFSTGANAYEKIMNVATGGVIVCVCGWLPGYYLTILTMGQRVPLGKYSFIFSRKIIQSMGFIMNALFYGILAGKFHSLSKAGFIIAFAGAQLFTNWGANSTTYIVAAEVHPTRFRSMAHGLSAAFGKCGALLASLTFNTLKTKIGVPNILWIFTGISLLGLASTFMLPNDMESRDPDAIELEERRQAWAEKNGLESAGVRVTGPAPVEEKINTV